jgi:hypothetical protein
MPLGAVWLVTVLAMWVLTTAVLAAMIGAIEPRATVGQLAATAMGSAVFACVVVGGPATGVALRVRRTCGPGRAMLSGLATAALVMFFVWSYLEASGTPVTGVWGVVTPVFVVAVAEIGLAFALRGRPAPVTGPGESGESGELMRPAGAAERGGRTWPAAPMLPLTRRSAPNVPHCDWCADPCSVY